MKYQPTTRKRVRATHHAIRRAPDGSAFQKCDECGVSVPVALVDMHECNGKKEVKKSKRDFNPPMCNQKKNVKNLEGDSIPPVCTDKKFKEEPRSPFIFFMESYAKTCKDQSLIEINREGFEKWKNMSLKERWPYVSEAQNVEAAYMKVIDQEINQSSQEEDDEVDSAIVGKFAKQHCEDYENSDSYHCCSSEEGKGACDWFKFCPWHC